MRKLVAMAALALLVAACADDVQAPRDVGDSGGQDTRGGSDGGGDPTGSDVSDTVDEEVYEPLDPVLNIAFDLRFDTDGFFADADARAVLDEAARQWGVVLLDDFATIEAGTWVYTRDPEDTSVEEWLEIESSIDDLLVFVGSAELTDAAARSSATAGFPAEIDEPELRAELKERWEGDDFEPWTGWIAYNADRNWFFDTTPRTGDDIPAGATDLLSVTLHELGHVLGIAPGGAYGRLIEDGHFVGPRAVAVYGEPVPLADGYGHIDESVTIDGQVPIMAIGRSRGVRYSITRLDIAMLADIGYEVLLD